MDFMALRLTQQKHIIGELTLADASNVAQKLFPADEAVDGDDIIGPLGIDGSSKDFKIQKRVVIAQDDTRPVKLSFTGDAGLVQPGIRRAQQIRQRPQVPLGADRRLSHVKTKE